MKSCNFMTFGLLNSYPARFFVDEVFTLFLSNIFFIFFFKMRLNFDEEFLLKPELEQSFLEIQAIQMQSDNGMV
jgi:hypothetical protein